MRLIFSGAGLLFITIVSIVIQFGTKQTFPQEFYFWAGLTVTTPILYFSSLPTLTKLSELKKFQFSIDIPLFLTLICCYVYSLFSTLAYSESNFAFFDSILMILFIYFASHYLEIFCHKRIKNCFLNINDFLNHQIKILKKNNEYHFCDLNEVTKGDILCIPGNVYFPIDGLICDHNGNLTQEKVAAGTFNYDSTVLMQATSDFKDSYFYKILPALQNPEKYKSNIPGTQLALWHQMLTLTLAAVIFCWWLPFDSEFALHCAIFILLVTCPYALAIVHPFLIACLQEKCAKKGILIKNPAAFLKLKKVNQIVFDKTGTLTEGNLVVEQIDYCNQASDQEVLPFIAAIEQQAHHPIARAIVEYARNTLISIPAIGVNNLQFFPGFGIKADFGEKNILIGSAKWLRKSGVFIPMTATEDENRITSDHVFVHCAINNVEVARIQMKDRIRQHALEVIQFLKGNNIEINLLSQDRPEIVNVVAKQLGPISATACVKPDAKEACIAALQDKGYTTMMIGDGLNDALALKQADIGISMDIKNPLSVLGCDVVFKQPDLSLIPTCFEISGFARKIINQNIFLAVTLNWALLPIAALGQITPMIALMTMCFSTLLVIGNTARLTYF